MSGFFNSTSIPFMNATKQILLTLMLRLVETSYIFSDYYAEEILANYTLMSIAQELSHAHMIGVILQAMEQN